MRRSGGVFVTFEGVDGSGKSTQARRLAERLRDAGRDVALTREPGGSPGAEDIRRLLLEGDPDRWSAETETLLFMAARRDHVERLIAPALERGAVVICDRFADSTRCYQTAGRGVSREVVEMLHREMIGLEPDLTFILDMDADTAHARGIARGDEELRFERFGADFQIALREAFRALAAEAPARCALIDASGAAEAVAARIDAVWAARIGQGAP